MARPREFDEEGAVRAACQEFWAKGYEATSTADLCRATGLPRSSLYNTFHSKEQLFRRALSHYVASMTSRHVAMLDRTGLSAGERIHALLQTIIDDELAAHAAQRAPGCFVVNTITDLDTHGPQVARILRADLERRLSALRLTIMDGQLDGSVASRRDPAELAWFVTTLISGMRVSAQAGAERTDLEAIAATAMTALQH